MTREHKVSMTAAGVLLAAGLSLSQAALAVPTLSIVTTDPTSVDIGASASVTFDFVIDAGTVSDGTTFTDVLVFHDVFVAYDPAVLALTGLSWGDALDAGATPNPQEILSANYTALGLNSNADPFTLGTPGTEVTDAVGTYIPGSLRMQQTAVNTAEELYGNQSDGATIFSLTFDIVTTQVAYTSIVLLDDSYFTTVTGFFDYKAGPTQTPFFAVVNENSVKVPEPASLALMAAGLLFFGGTYRRR